MIPPPIAAPAVNRNFRRDGHQRPGDVPAPNPTPPTMSRFAPVSRATYSGWISAHPERFQVDLQPFHQTSACSGHLLGWQVVRSRFVICWGVVETCSGMIPAGAFEVHQTSDPDTGFSRTTSLPQHQSAEFRRQGVSERYEDHKDYLK
jgi:hypothetical protein